MESLINLLLKVFNNEPLERLMYVILFWALALCAIPSDFAMSVNEKTHIPWLFHIFLFALTYVLALMFSRVRLRVVKSKPSGQERNETRIIKTLNKLSQNEREIIIEYLDTRAVGIRLHARDPRISTLQKKGIAKPHTQIDDNEWFCMLDEEVCKVAVKAWEPYTQKFTLKKR